jgi:ABC-type antimicrobial peptide transport system permease subunit
LIFSTTLLASFSNVEANTNYYNNGAELRIETQSTHYSMETSLMLEEGIENVMSVLKTSGEHADYDRVTLIGVDVDKYLEIGRWIDNSFINDPIYVSEFYMDRTTEDWLNALDLVQDGIIISDGLAYDGQYTVGETINIDEILVGSTTYIEQDFTITGIIHSAPGFGLATGENLELDQPNDHFALINFRKANEDFAVNNTNLFFASLEEGYQLDEVISSITSYEDVLAVNPDFTSEGFSEKYINNYVPKINTFLVVQIIFISFSGLLIITSNISYIISIRKRNLAILSILGTTKVTSTSTIITEILLLDTLAIGFGLALGLPIGLL